MEPYQVWQIVTGVAILAFLVVWLVSQMTSQEQVGQWLGYVRRGSLMMFVLTTAVFFLIPPSQKLKPGLDLAGGTVLTYEVDTSGAMDPKATIAQVIDVLKRRVDPDGLKNLVWRPVGTSRIEIQMPAPPKGTKQLRQAYQVAREKLLANNLDMQAVDAALRLPPAQREAEFDRLAPPGSQRRENLATLAKATDKLVAARTAYDAAKAAYNQATRAKALLPKDADEATRSAAEKAAKQAEQAYLDATAPLLQAQQAEQRARKLVQASNISELSLDAAFEQPNDPNKVKQGQKTLRMQAMERLIAEHPDLAEPIRNVFQAYAEYEKFKGTLDDPNDLKALLRGSGVLEFRIAAADVPNLNEYVQRLQEQGPLAGINEPYRWFEIDNPVQFANRASDIKLIRENPLAFFTYERTRLHVREYAGKLYALLSNVEGEKMVMGQDEWTVTGARRSMDESGFPAIAFTLDPRGGQLMSGMTSSRVGRQMAIILDGKLMSAPTIRSALSSNISVTGGSGGFSENEMQYLLQTLNAGSLQATLSPEPVAEMTMGAQFGEDNLRAGLEASILALVLVAAFMAVYYLFSGLVADFALLANMVIILGVMAMLEATFTMPGIAGIVLTIGMSVDANVLIFERIREELERNVEVHTAVRLGYEKALSTILDANITTLITCVVLGYFTTPEIVGFAKTLGIGILATMFTALFCTRLLIDLYLALTHAKTLNMLPTIFTTISRALSPDINWVGLRPLFLSLSLAAVIASGSLIAWRGKDLLDIEFRSGTQVSFDLGQDDHGQQRTLSLKEARERLQKVGEQHNLPSIANANIVALGEQVDGKATGFAVKTLDQNLTEVSTAIKQAFADVLNTTQQITFKGMGPAANAQAPPVGRSPVYMVRQSRLGDVINRPDVDTNVSSFLGGVAILLEDLSEPITIDQLQQRIRRMRSQQQYESIPGTREYKIVPLELAAGKAPDAAPRYSALAVMIRDSTTNYLERPEEFTIRGGFADTQWHLVRDAMLRDTSLGSISNFSSQVSKTMTQQAIVAMALSLLAVVAYIWFRFGSLRYGLAAIVALVHDVTIALGCLGLAGLMYESIGSVGIFLLSDFRIDLVLVAALLTIVGYSLNDTIVVFDRIRENRGRLAIATPQIINDSINQTISRTVLTSGTTLLAVFTLYAFGGIGVHGFAFAMLIGIIVGTYSSIAIAAPVLLIGGGGAVSIPSRTDSTGNTGKRRRKTLASTGTRAARSS